MIGEILSVESFVWTCLWQSMVLVVGGLTASFLLRRRSSRAHQILLLSIIAAVSVPIISVLVKHYELGVFVAEPIALQAQLEDGASAGDFSLLAQDFAYEAGPLEGDLSSITAGPQGVVVQWTRIALYAWIAASLMLAVRLLVTFLLGVRLLGRAEPLDCAKMAEAIHSARAKLGIGREVEVYSSRGVRSPAIWCWRRRPVLLVPDAVGRSGSAVDWAGVLCHELAHWKRRDHISGLLAELAVCMLPWHLLLWWAKSRLISLSEQACDDWVLATGQPGADYAESLLDLTPGKQMAFVPAVVGRRKGLSGRVRRILMNSCGNPRTGAAWAMAVSITAICLAAGLAFAQTRPAKPETATAVTEPNESMERVNFQGAEIKTLAKSLSEWTGKVVIVPPSELMKQRISTYAPKKLPRDEATTLIYKALRLKGYIVEETDVAVFIKPTSEDKSGVIPVVSDSNPLSNIDKDQVVQKFFKLTHYNPAEMSQIVGPLLSDAGSKQVDEKTNTLLLIDTAGRLTHIEKIIAQLDVHAADRLVTEIFKIRYGDPSDIVQILVRLLRGPRDERAVADPTVSTVTGPSGQPVVLIPAQRRRWIIARASSDAMKKVAEWIEKLDTVDEAKKEYEVVQLGYADVNEVADRLNAAIQKMPGTELQQRVLIRALIQARQILIFGPAHKREMLKTLIAEIDIPAGLFTTRSFKLKYADAVKVKEKLEDLYTRPADDSSSSDGNRRRPRDAEVAEKVRIIALPAMQQVTVIATPENLLKISGQIAEWDVPLDLGQIRPRIITLRNSDPVRMAGLLTKLFAGESGNEVSLYDAMFGKEAEEKLTTLGMLRRQLKFEAVPGTKKIIIISNFPRAYKIVEELILELDKQKMVAKDVKQIREWIAKLQSEGRLKRSSISAVKILIETHALTMDVNVLKGLSLDAVSVGGSRSWSEFLADDSAQSASFILEQPAVDFLLDLAREKEDAKMFTSQRVFVKDGEEGSLFTGEQIAFVSGYSEPNAPSEKPTPEIKYMQVGTSIRLRAYLTPDKAKAQLSVESSSTRIRGFKKSTYMDRYSHMVPQRENFSTGTSHTVHLGKTLLIGQRISKSNWPIPADVTQVKRDLPDDQTSPRQIDILLTLAKPTVSGK